MKCAPIRLDLLRPRIAVLLRHGRSVHQGSGAKAQNFPHSHLARLKSCPFTCYLGLNGTTIGRALPLCSYPLIALL